MTVFGKRHDGVASTVARPNGAGPRRGAPELAWLLLSLIRLYQLVLGPLFAGVCRYEPSCSRFAHEAIRVHGPLHGTLLSVRRLLSCRPFGGSGYDPVPLPDRGALGPESARPRPPAAKRPPPTRLRRSEAPEAPGAALPRGPGPAATMDRRPDSRGQGVSPYTQRSGLPSPRRS